MLPAHARGSRSGFWPACPGDHRLTWHEAGPIPGVSWDGWRALLHVDWSDLERSEPGWFDTDTILKAAAAAPSQEMAPINETWWGSHVPRLDADPAWTSYETAAALFHDGQWREAKAQFDAIAVSFSPFRPEAAYSAARSALETGDVAGGVQRIAALFGDPKDERMEGAAHDLLGRFGATGSPPLLAARLAEISHLLMVPPALRCAKPELARLARMADDDQDHLRMIAFPTDHEHGDGWNGADAAVFREVGAIDPVIELLRVVDAPSPYDHTRWAEPFYPQAFAFPGLQLREQTMLVAERGVIAKALATARRRAADGGNPLWAFALARLSADPVDLPAIRQGEQAAVAERDVPADRRALAALLAAHEIRILLIAGRIDEAERVLRQDAALLAVDIAGPMGGAADYVRIGGTSLLLARRDVAGARAWAAAVRLPAGESEHSFKQSFPLMLATSWDETLKPGMGARARSQGYQPPDTMPQAVAAALDLLPADRLASLSRLPGLRPAWRRPILGAAWIRDWMLGRQAAFIGLFPDVRAAFPELDADLDTIDHAWLPWTRRRLATRMMLRFPGLSTRVLWNRDASPGRYSPDWSSKLSAPDRLDPNDGSWWCPLDPARAQRDAFALMTENLTTAWYVDPVSFDTVFANDDRPKTPSIDTLATSWLAVFPLTRDANGAAELAALSRAPSGPYQLAREAIAWSEQSNMLTRLFGLDDQLPETLALAVRATRYGCRVAEPLGPESRRAWIALHRVAPESEWAQRTPYWFAENGVQPGN